MARRGTAAWKAATGGDATSNNVDFAQKQIKQAGIIATQDPSWDMMYTTSAYGYIPKFGARLLLPVTSDPDSYGQDLSDFFDGAKAALTTSDGVLRAVPLYASPSVWTWNKKLFDEDRRGPGEPAGQLSGPVQARPTKFKAAGIIPSIQPWLATQAILFAQLYFTYIFNSTAVADVQPGLHPDRVRQRRRQGSLRADRGGLQDRVLGPEVHEHHQRARRLQDLPATATSRCSDGARAPSRPARWPIRRTSASSRIPAIGPGRPARPAAPTASASASSRRRWPRAWSWSRYNFSPEVELAAATTVKDSTGALVLYPVARTSVVADPDVIKAQPLQPVYAEQNKGNTNPWSTPYDTTPVFNEVISKMISGDYDAAARRTRPR